MEDAVVFGNLLMALLRHADRIGIACLAQLVNVIAPIRSEARSAWRQTIFYPFALTARHARGDVLHVQQKASTYPTAYGDTQVTDVIATREPSSGGVTVFAVNRDQDQDTVLDIDVGAFEDLRVVEYLYLGGAGPRDANTEAEPERVIPRQGHGATVESGRVNLRLPPVSWTMLRLEPATAS